MLLVEHAPSKASVRTEKTKRLRKVVISSQPYVRIFPSLTDLSLMAGWLGTGPVESENAPSPFHALDPVGIVTFCTPSFCQKKAKGCLDRTNILLQ